MTKPQIENIPSAETPHFLCDICEANPSRKETLNGIVAYCTCSEARWGYGMTMGVAKRQSCKHFREAS